MPNQNQAGHRFGTPVNADPSNIQQHYNDTCAVRCQEIILRDYGIYVTEEQAVQEAISMGIYTPGQGTPMEDVGKYMESKGVAITQTENANIFNLVNELGQGHRVIVGVDADEIWGSTGWLHDLGELFTPSGANHALIVSEIDTSDPNNVKVILTDPGTGDVAKEYTLEEFQDAWSDSNCFMVSTNNPPPQDMNLPEMANFDYTMGHLDYVFNMPWNDFSYAYDHYNLYDLMPQDPAFDMWYDMVSSGNTDWASYPQMTLDPEPTFDPFVNMDMNPMPSMDPLMDSFSTWEPMNPGFGPGMDSPDPGFDSGFDC